MHVILIGIQGYCRALCYQPSMSLPVRLSLDTLTIGALFSNNFSQLVAAGNVYLPWEPLNQQND